MTIRIFGAGGLGREVLATLQAQGSPVAGFFVDEGFTASPIRGLPVHVYDSQRDDAGLVLAIGDNLARSRLRSRLGARATYTSAIHPAAVIGPGVTLGTGAMVVGPASMTTDIVIGSHVLINPGCSIAHDCTVGDFCSLGPSVALAGNVQVSEGASIGTGAIVLPGIRIGAWAVVGAGAVVVHDVPPGATVVGVPARPSRSAKARSPAP